MSQHGPHPLPPGYQPAPAPPIEPPTAVVYARAMIFLALGLSLLRLVLVIFVVDMPEVDEEDTLPESLETALTAVSVALAIGATALWVVIAVFIMRAANWARIVALVLSTLEVVGAIILFASYATVEPEMRPPLGVNTLDGAQALLTISATVLMWIPVSNRFFRIPMYVRRGWPIPPR